MNSIILHLRLAEYRAQISIRAVVGEVLAFGRQVFTLVPFSREIPPRPGDSSVSKSWLETILAENGFLSDGKRISAVHVVSLAENRGLSSCVLSVTVEVFGALGNLLDPIKLVLKMSHRGFEGRRSVIIGGRAREGILYEKSQKKTMAIPGLLHPLVLYSHGSDLLGEYVLLMEDLHTKESVGMNMILGNQIWGVPDNLRSFADPVQVLKKAFTQAAILHAFYWNQTSLMKMEWLKSVSWYNGKGRCEWEIAVNRARIAWVKTKSKIDSGLCELYIDPILSSVIEKTLKNSSWEVLQSHLRNPIVPWTLCHGDFHASNMIYIKDMVNVEVSDGKDNLGLLVSVDWSEVGIWEGTTDLAQLIISDVKPHVFIRHAKEIVLAYWNMLISRGVSKDAYTFDQCWGSFCRGGMERWIWIFVVISALPSLPTVAVQYFHDQLLAFYRAFGENTPFYTLKLVVCVT